jgi:hypothetical protein
MRQAKRQLLHAQGIRPRGCPTVQPQFGPTAVQSEDFYLVKRDLRAAQRLDSSFLGSEAGRERRRTLPNLGELPVRVNAAAKAVTEAPQRSLDTADFDDVDTNLESCHARPLVRVRRLRQNWASITLARRTPDLLWGL